MKNSSVFGLRGSVGRRRRVKRVLRPAKALLAAVFLAGWRGEAGDSEHLTLEEIVVTAETLQEPSTSVIGQQTIEKGRNLSIPDAIKDQPGITLQRRAAVGDTGDTVSIRGLSGNRLMLTINGRPVNAAGVVGGHYIDWGTIPLDNIEKIELIRGGNSVRYGNNALGGVINVITKAPTEKPEFSFYSNFAAGKDIDYIWNHRLTHSYKVGPLGYSLSGSFQKADEFLWNNDFEGRNLSLNLALDMPLEGIFSFGLQYANARRGFIRENRQSTDPTNPGFNQKRNGDYPLAFGETLSPYSGTAFITGPGAYWDKTKTYLDVGYLQPIDDATLELKLYANHEDRDEKNYSTAGTAPGYGNGVLVLDRTVESDRSYGGRLELTAPIGEHEFLMGVDHQALRYGDTVLNYVDHDYNNINWTQYGNAPATGFEPSSKGTFWGVYLQDSWSVTDRLLLTVGARCDQYRITSINGSVLPETDGDDVTPKLTGTYKLTEADTVTVSVYQALRTPGLPETYWWGYGETKGTPALKAEKNTAAEWVFRHAFADRGFVRLSAYYYDIEDYIMFRFDPVWKGVYNIDRVVLTGASLDGRFRVVSGVTARAGLTCQKSRKVGDAFDTAGLSDEIDYLPRWKATAGVDINLPWRAVLSADVRYVDERKMIYAYRDYPQQWGPPQDAFKLMHLDAYATLDLSLKIPFTEYGEVNVYIENVCDKSYEEQFGYPLPGRTAGVSLKVTF